MQGGYKIPVLPVSRNTRKVNNNLKNTQNYANYLYKFRYLSQSLNELNTIKLI